LDVYGASIYNYLSFGKDDKQYGTNNWEGETFSCPHNTRTFLVHTTLFLNNYIGYIN
jgi:hypothetical protein